MKPFFFLIFFVAVGYSYPVNNCPARETCITCVRNSLCTWAIINGKVGGCHSDSELGGSDVLLSFHREADCSIYEEVREEYEELFGEEAKELERGKELPKVSAVILMDPTTQIENTSMISRSLSTSSTTIPPSRIPSQSTHPTEGFPNQPTVVPSNALPQKEFLTSKNKNVRRLNTTKTSPRSIKPVSLKDVERNTDSAYNTVKIFDKEPLISKLKRSLCNSYKFAIRYEKAYPSLYYAMPRYYVYTRANPMALRRLECQLLEENKEMYKKQSMKNKLPLVHE